MALNEILISYELKQTFSIMKQGICMQYEEFNALLNSKITYYWHIWIKKFCCTRFSFKTQFKIEFLLPLSGSRNGLK